VESDYTPAPPVRSSSVSTLTATLYCCCPLLQVFVSGPGLPNLNLVDQPGLIAPNPKSSLPETVERIVTRNANAPGSLILNVVPVEQVRLFVRVCVSSCESVSLSRLVCLSVSCGQLLCCRHDTWRPS
jgi:hypothetical protein